MLDSFHKGTDRIYQKKRAIEFFLFQEKKNRKLTKSLQGQHGRIAVIGGSEDYAGAPYFSAMASARLGCDMASSIPYIVPSLHAWEKTARPANVG